MYTPIPPRPDPYNNPTRPSYNPPPAPPPPPGRPYYPSRPYDPYGDSGGNPNLPQNPAPPSIPPSPPQAAPVVSAGAEAALKRIEKYFEDLELPAVGTTEFELLQTDTLAIIDDIIYEEVDNHNETFGLVTYVLYKNYGDIMIGASTRKNMERVAEGLQQRKTNSGN
jgi:hypothetical protein